MKPLLQWCLKLVFSLGFFALLIPFFLAPFLGLIFISSLFDYFPFYYMDGITLVVVMVFLMWVSCVVMWDVWQKYYPKSWLEKLYKWAGFEDERFRY